MSEDDFFSGMDAFAAGILLGDPEDVRELDRKVAQQQNVRRIRESSPFIEQRREMDALVDAQLKAFRENPPKRDLGDEIRPAILDGRTIQPPKVK